MDKVEKCPNPNGELGICYSFDRFGGRCGCVGCPLLETLPKGMFNEGDPLPGLSKQINVNALIEKIKMGSQTNASDTIIDKDECKLLADIINELSMILKEGEKIAKEGINNTETAINFYRESQEYKGEYASELHLLTVRLTNLSDISRIFQLHSAPLLKLIYNGDERR